MQKNVDSLVQVELFCNYFEKSIQTHPQKIVLQNHLNNFKQNISANHDNLEKCYDYLLELSNSLTSENQRRISTGNEKELKFLNHQYSERGFKDSFGLDLQNLPSFDQNTNRTYNIINICRLPDFHTLKIFPHFQSLQSVIFKYSHVKEVQKDGNTFFRILGLRYFEYLFAEHKVEEVKSIIEEVFLKKLELRNYYLLEEDSVKEEMRRKFCGYLYQIINVITESDGVQANILFSKMTNGDPQFLNCILAYSKGKILQYIESRGTNGLKELDKELESKNIEDITHKIKSSIEEPPSIIVKISSAAFRKNINFVMIDEKQVNEEKYIQNHNSPSFFHILCLKHSFTVYYSLYETFDVYWETSEHSGRRSNSFPKQIKKDHLYSNQLMIQPVKNDKNSPPKLTSISNQQPASLRTPNSKAIKSMVTENNSHNIFQQYRGMKSDEGSKENTTGNSFYEDSTPLQISSKQLKKAGSNKANYESFQTSNFENIDTIQKFTTTVKNPPMTERDDRLSLEKLSYLNDFILSLTKNTKSIEQSLLPFDLDQIYEDSSSNRNVKTKPYVQINQQPVNQVTKSSETDDMFHLMTEYNTGNKIYQGKRENQSNYDLSSSMNNQQKSFPNLKIPKQLSDDQSKFNMSPLFVGNSNSSQVKAAFIQKCTNCQRDYVAYEIKNDNDYLCHICR